MRRGDRRGRQLLPPADPPRHRKGTEAPGGGGGGADGEGVFIELTAA